MLYQVITKGIVKFSGIKYYLDDGKELWRLGAWAFHYQGKPLIIIVETDKPIKIGPEAEFEIRLAELSED